MVESVFWIARDEERKFDFCKGCPFYECELIDEYTQFKESHIQSNKSQFPIVKCVTADSFDYTKNDVVLVQAVSVKTRRDKQDNDTYLTNLCSEGANSSDVEIRSYDQSKLEDRCIMNYPHVYQVECGRKMVTEGIGDHYKIEITEKKNYYSSGKKIIKEGNRLEKFTLPRAEAIQFMEERQEPYKVELIRDLPEDTEISFYKQGDGFTDLCAGPHLMSTKSIKAFKLISSSMAYWRGDSNKAQLQRIYGTAFAAKDELNEYLEHLEDIKKRDHNKLGREMKLFTTVDVIGQGLPLLMPRGAKMIQTMQRWIEDLEDNEWGYIRTKTPLMAKSDLYKISGHWDHYTDGMFVLGDEEKDKEVLALRPMTCPFQYYVYKAEQHSYRDLPLRYSETSTLFRNEDSGEMHGLTRVRQFTISEGHLIVRPDQMVEEFKKCIALAKHCLSTLGVEEDVTYHLSKWDPENREKYIGEPEVWEETQQHMREIMDELNIRYTEDVGEAAFYGPKIDINTKNVYGKEDTMITIQWDALLAEQFDMYYIDQNGDKVRPYIIHRTSMGCY